jgi:hypothetical protein
MFDNSDKASYIYAITEKEKKYGRSTDSEIAENYR